MKKMLLLTLLGLIWVCGCVSVHKVDCEGVDERMDRIEKRVGGLENRQALETRLDRLERRLNEVEKHLDKLDSVKVLPLGK